MREFNYSSFNDVQWDNELVALLAQIHECKGRQELYLKQKPAVLDHLVEVAKIQSTESSNKIEGIVTTNTRIKELVAECKWSFQGDSSATLTGQRMPCSWASPSAGPQAG